MNDSKFFNKKTVTAVFSLLVVALAIPVTYYMVGQSQDNRQHAAGPGDILTNLLSPTKNPNQTQFSTASVTNTPTPPQVNGQTCTSKPADIALVIDVSPSMAGQKLTQAESAAKNFVDIMAKDTQNKVALISFSSTGTVEVPFTNDFNSVKNKIDTLKVKSATCAECGIKTANQEIAKLTDNQKKVVIFLTDGQANWTTDQNSAGIGTPVAASVAEPRALTQVTQGFNANGTVFYSVGLGSDVDANFLKQIATTTGGEYYFSPTQDQLTDIYNTISQLVGKGAISGYVFNDANGNKTLDSSEQKLPNISIDVKNASGAAVVETVTTDSSGDYSATGLCDGNYTVNEELQDGWTTTVPTNNSYPITIANADSHKDTIFGNTQAPQDTLVSVSVVLPGIGTDGNTSPTHASRSAELKIFDTSNQAVIDKTITLSFNGTSFDSTVDLGTSFKAGQYYGWIKLPNSLSKTIPGITTITAGKTTAFPQVALVTGDINNDNQLDVVDYNLFISCIGVKVCPQKDFANLNDDAKDLNDNGQAEDNVDGIDYNILLRAFASRGGQ